MLIAIYLESYIISELEKECQISTACVYEVIV